GGVDCAAFGAAEGRWRVQVIRRIQWQEFIMGIFDKIMSTIFGSEANAASAPAGGAAPAGTPAVGKPAAGASAAAAVDVAANLDALAKASKEKFDWRKSIVDLIKLLKLFSGLAARK